MLEYYDFTVLANQTKMFEPPDARGLCISEVPLIQMFNDDINVSLLVGYFHGEGLSRIQFRPMGLDTNDWGQVSLLPQSSKVMGALRKHQRSRAECFGRNLGQEECDV